MICRTGQICILQLPTTNFIFSHYFKLELYSFCEPCPYSIRVLGIYMQESRLKWYGHVLRREDEYVGKRVMVMDVPGRRRRGRPKRRWLDSIRNDLSERELSWEYAQDRANRRRLIRHVDHI